MKGHPWRTTILVCAVIAILLSVFHVRAPRVPTRGELFAQLAGEACLYQMHEGVLVERTFWNHFRRREDAAWCIVDATRALATMDRSPETVPRMIVAVKVQSDIDLGDDLVPVRSTLVEVLGKMGDKSAIPVLREIYDTDDFTILSKEAHVPSGYIPRQQTSVNAARQAILRIIADQ